MVEPTRPVPVPGAAQGGADKVDGAKLNKKETVLDQLKKTKDALKAKISDKEFSAALCFLCGLGLALAIGLVVGLCANPFTAPIVLGVILAGFIVTGLSAWLSATADHDKLAEVESDIAQEVANQVAAQAAQPTPPPQVQGAAV